jgi:predicted nucleotidyltransferase component of viral defense system
MNLNDLHRRLLRDVLEVGNAFPLVITGGYAVQAHRIVDRFSRDIDMATDSAVTMEAIVATVVEGLVLRGWGVEVIGVDPHGARMMTTDRGSGEQCELDILRETFSRPPETTPYGPVLALDDVIGTKVRALAGRGLPRDLIDITPRPGFGPRLSLRPSAGVTPGKMSSLLRISSSALTAPTGTTTRHSPSTD